MLFNLLGDGVLVVFVWWCWVVVFCDLGMGWVGGVSRV